jgi:pimeloyl-ACP methyl ester carboxylesterase
VAVAVPLAVYFLQDSLIFHRQPLAEARRAQIAGQSGVGEIWLAAADGTRVHAWHLDAGGPLVLYFGGNAEEVSWMLDAARAEAPGTSWLLLDYRGYGLSEGSPSQKALIADALALHDHAVTLPGAEGRRVYAFGRSLGSGVAVALAAERPLKGIILSTPYDSLLAVAKRHYGFLPVSWLLKHPFDSIALAPRLDVPLLCLIAGRDDVIPPEHAERLLAAWRGPKRRIFLPAATHNTTDEAPEFWASIRAFLADPGDNPPAR